MRPLLDFGTFSKIFEAEETKSPYSPIVDSYFQIYSDLVGQVAGYKDSAADLTDIGEAKIEEKAKVFGDIFLKIQKMIKDERVSELIKNYYLPATKDLVLAYNAFLEKASDEDKAEAQKITKERVKEYINKLISAANQIKEGFSYREDDLLFEKQTFKDERANLARELVSFQGDVNSSMKNPSSDKLLAELKPLSKKSSDLSTELSDDEAWEKMRKKDRKDRIVKIGEEIAEMKDKRIQVMTNELKNMGLDQTISKNIAAAQEKLSKATEESAKIAQEKINSPAPEEAKGEESEESKEEEAAQSELQKDFTSKDLKIGDYKEIKSGNVDVKNLQKKGSNLKEIQKAQEDLNKFLPADSQIKADGLYGKNTEEAIKKVSATLGLLNKDAKSDDGKSLTPTFRAVLSKAVEKGGPTKIKEMMDAAKEKMKGNEKAAGKIENLEKATEVLSDVKAAASKLMRGEETTTKGEQTQPGEKTTDQAKPDEKKGDVAKAEGEKDKKDRKVGGKIKSFLKDKLGKKDKE